MAGIQRRTFLKLSAAAAATASAPAMVDAMELKLGGQDFHQIRTFHPRQRKNFLCTLCPYFDGGFTYAEQDEIKKAEGDPDHIATRGKFCSKGLSSFFAATDPDRILTPLKRVGARGEGKWQEVDWKEAIALVAAKVKEAVQESPDSVVLNEGGFKDGATTRFMDTIGSASVIRSSFPRIGNVTKQAALKRALGVDFAIPDLEHTKLVLNFGANILETALPLAQRLTDGIVNNRLKLVTFDVRMSNTAGRSHEWYPVFPGSDGIIALAMANVIMSKGLADTAFIDTWTNQSSAALAEALKPFTPAVAEQASGVSAKVIKQLAVEFAKNKPATVFSMNGVTAHHNGIDAEAACLLLAAITGNVEKEGGVCLPRFYEIKPIQPAPAQKGSVARQLNYTFPFEVQEGKRPVRVLLNHMSNPAYTSPAASVWREVLKDEKQIPFIVDFTPFMSETAEFADLVLPDLVAVERHDLGSAPTSLFPWVGMSYPDVKPKGQAQDVRETLKKIVHALDADGSLGMKKFWAFSDAKDWVKREVAATPEIAKEYKDLRSKGVWPDYGEIDPATRQIVKKGEPVEAKYGLHKDAGFPTKSGKMEIAPPAWAANPRLRDIKPDQFVLTTFKVAYHTLSMTSNLKYLSELWHANPLWINKDVAQKLGIADGGLVRVESEVGYLVTKAWVTQGVHPQVVSMSTSVGRTSYGRVAQANPHLRASFAKREQEDPDIEANVWWRDGGTNPNDIIPLSIDPVTGAQAWNDTVVTVAPAKPGDKYGEIKVDNAKHHAVYKRLLGQA